MLCSVISNAYKRLTKRANELFPHTASDSSEKGDTQPICCLLIKSSPLALRKRGGILFPFGSLKAYLIFLAGCPNPLLRIRIKRILRPMKTRALLSLRK